MDKLDVLLLILLIMLDVSGFFFARDGLYDLLFSVAGKNPAKKIWEDIKRKNAVTLRSLTHYIGEDDKTFQRVYRLYSIFLCQVVPKFVIFLALCVFGESRFCHIIQFVLIGVSLLFSLSFRIPELPSGTEYRRRFKR